MQVLAAQAEASDKRFVALEVRPLEVLEQASTAADHHQEPAPAVVVFVVGLKVLAEAVDTFGQQRDLDLGRTGVFGGTAVLGDYTELSLACQRHKYLSFWWIAAASDSVGETALPLLVFPCFGYSTPRF